MAEGRATFSEARLLRLLAVAREQGLQPTAVRVERDGAIEMSFGGTPTAPVDPFEAVDPRR